MESDRRTLSPLALYRDGFHSTPLIASPSAVLYTTSQLVGVPYLHWILSWPYSIVTLRTSSGPFGHAFGAALGESRENKNFGFLRRSSAVRASCAFLRGSPLRLAEVTIRLGWLRSLRAASTARHLCRGPTSDRSPSRPLAAAFSSTALCSHSNPRTCPCSPCRGPAGPVPRHRALSPTASPRAPPYPAEAPMSPRRVPSRLYATPSDPFRYGLRQACRGAWSLRRRGRGDRSDGLTPFDRYGGQMSMPCGTYRRVISGSPEADSPTAWLALRES